MIGILLCGVTVVFINATDIAAMAWQRHSDLAMFCLLKAAFALLLSLASVVLWCINPRDGIRLLNAVGNFALMVWNLYLCEWLVMALNSV